MFDFGRKQREINWKVQSWNRKYIGFEVLQLGQLERQIQGEFDQKRAVEKSSSLGFCMNSRYLEEDPDERRFVNRASGFLWDRESTTFTSKNNVNMGTSKVLHLYHKQKQKKPLLLQQEKLDILILNHLYAIHPEFAGPEPITLDLTPAAHFWENRHNPSVKSNTLVYDFDRANLITREFDHWLIDRFDESVPGFLSVYRERLTQPQFLEQLVLAMQGIPNKVYEIRWLLYSPKTREVLEDRELEVMFEANSMTPRVKGFLGNPQVSPKCLPKKTQVQDCSHVFADSLLRRLCPKVEELLEVFQLILEENANQNERDYFENSLLKKIKEMMVSFFAFRMIRFPRTRLIDFLVEFEEFYLEMREVFRFLSFCKLSRKGLLDLCYSFKAAISTDSRLFQWIQRWDYKGNLVFSVL